VGQAIIGGPRGLWMRDGPEIVNIQLPLLSADGDEQEVEFKNVVIYDFSEESELEAITRAESASHDGATWNLEGVSTVQFQGRSAVREDTPRRSWPTQVRPELLDSAVTRPQRLSMRSLWEFLGYLGENGLDDRVYEVAFWEKMFYPLTVVALVLAGMPFVFATSRSQNVGVRMFIGMMLGGLFMIVSRSMLNLGEAYGLPTVLGTLLPPLLLGIGSILVLRRTV
jgi:lipopolysaccharide export system permease protein